MGDFNNDSLDKANVSEIEYLIFISTHSTNQTVTQITCHTETLINNIYISNSVNIDSSGILVISLE